MHRFLLLALVSTLFFSGQVDAQRGRLIKRLRDDIFGTESSQKEGSKAKPGTQNPANEKQPTLADPMRNVPKPADNRYVPNRNPNPVAGIKKLPFSPLGSGAKREGFGMSIKLNRDDQLIVSNVDPNGNAARAGVRPGDQILEIGGMEATTVEEFEEIAKIMSAGDQLELRFKRGSETDKILVQYGETPEVQDRTVQNAELGPGNVQAPKTNVDFAPPLQDPGTGPLRSVLDETPNPKSPNAFGASFGSRQQLDFLKRTVQTQQQTIRQLQNEVLQLRNALQERR
jgi:hypothetical protein